MNAALDACLADDPLAAPPPTMTAPGPEGVELLPCPCCHSTDVLWWVGLNEFVDGEVHCQSCGVTSGNHPSIQEAFAIWNTRAPAPSAREQVLEEAAKAADDMWGEGPDGHYDNGATSDGFNIATQRIAAAIRALITEPKGDDE